MATQKQIAANQQNAKKSTGPKDTSKTRYNACYHGLRGSSVLLHNESREEYGKFAETFFNDFQPVGTYEHELVHRLVNRLWELNRIATLKTQVADEAYYRNIMQDELLKLERYETSIERSIFRLRRELTQAQTTRQKQQAEGIRNIEDAPSKRTGPILFETPADPENLYKGPGFENFLNTEAEEAFHGLYQEALGLFQADLKRYPTNRQTLPEYMAERINRQLGTFGQNPENQPPTPHG